jgi:eukaryotic-like serine/threonine-protein kinase
VDDEWAVPGYTPMRELGVGNGGRVVLAVHDASGVPVAIKYLADRLFADKIFLTRFRVEARILAGIRDPHLVRFYEYVETSGAAAIIMELVDGINLRALLRRAGPTGPEAALSVLKGSLLGLAAAHEAGVVHRDYKPANVLIDGAGDSKLADFGIALPAGHPASASGTPAYMAPEQWAGLPATPASDVYAATAVFYECITGRPPYERKTAALLAQAHESAPIPINEVPEPLWVMFAHGLAKDPMDRPQSAALFLDEVEEAARAAYGPKWDSRGRHRLVEMAALLALLFPLAEPPSRIASALGLTRLGKDKAKTLAAAGAGMAIIMAGAGIAALAAGNKIHVPNAIAAPMSTPRPLANDKGKDVGPAVRPAPSPTWKMPGGLPTGGWTPTPPGSLPTTPVGNTAPAGGGGTGPGGSGTGPGGGSSGSGTTTPPGGGGTGGNNPGGQTGGGGSTSSPPTETGGDPTPPTGGGGGDPTPTDEPTVTPTPVESPPPVVDPSAPVSQSSGGVEVALPGTGLSVG